MTFTIALAGKGSAGKSTLVPHFIQTLRQAHPTLRLLVVDADPHQSATTVLGVREPTTLGHIRSRYERTFARGEGLRDETRDAFAERAMGGEALMHLDGFDLLTMGHWELSGSQCTINRVLERALVSLMGDYNVVLIDNEAGIEHIGRLASIPLDLLLLVCMPDPLFFDVAQRILERCYEVQRHIARRWLVLNRVQPDDLGDPLLWDEIGRLPRAELVALLPESAALRRLSRAAVSLLELDPTEQWAQAVAELGQQMAHILTNSTERPPQTTLPIGPLPITTSVDA